MIFQEDSFSLKNGMIIKGTCMWVRAERLSSNITESEVKEVCKSGHLPTIWSAIYKFNQENPTRKLQLNQRMFVKNANGELEKVVYNHMADTYVENAIVRKKKEALKLSVHLRNYDECCQTYL